MGIQDISQSGDQNGQHPLRMRHLLADLRALQTMLEEGLFETGVRRIGVEQELVLVDRCWQPAPVADDVLALADDDHLTNELARFNLEFNGDPYLFTGSCLGDVERQMRGLLEVVDRSAARLGVTPLLAGICPTVSLAHLSLDNMAPRPRYYELNDAITRLRGGHYELDARGVDELRLRHDNIMLEAVNTSFQIHWQVDPDRFAHEYNIAQAIAGPVLAACVNSPILVGKRLWQETRIAIFEQTVDTRSGTRPADRDLLARVRFGERWLERSVLEIFKEDTARFRLLFGPAQAEQPIETLARGDIPRLYALQTHNSTVYRWNRPCYGITGGKPHLRIECRILPSGPTIIDELAGAALWYGLMNRLPGAIADLTARMDFDDAKSNFAGCARHGLSAQVTWLDGRTLPVAELLTAELIPAARAGLRAAGIDQPDIDRLLGVMDARVASGQTGARWLLGSIQQMRHRGTRSERLTCLAAATSARQRTGEPVHTWEPARLGECGNWRDHYARVGQYMTTDIFTVQADELIDLAASIMDWEKVRHVPVEDAEHRLVGIVSYRDMLRLLADPTRDDAKPISVGEIMRTEPVTVAPGTPTLEAIELMRAHGVSCLPVVDDGRLVGIVSEHDYMRIAGRLLEEQLGKPGGVVDGADG